MYNVVLTPAGVVALTKVAQWLEAGAPHVTVTTNGRKLDSFDMEYGVNVDYENPTCGTSCCIAGAVAQFEGLGYLDEGNLGFFGDGGVEGLTTALLVGDEKSVEDPRCMAPLFLPWSYFNPVGWDSEDCNAHLFSVPKEAAQVVRHLLDTGVIDWTIVDDGEKFEKL